MTISPRDFEYLAQLIRERSAIVLESGKEYLVEARLEPIARSQEFASLAALVSKLRTDRDPKLVDMVIEAMTTNETSFYRDYHPFEYMKTEVIPEIIKRRESERRISIWCAASSTGQEPYSLAMMLLNEFPQLASWDVEFIATDLSEKVLEKAREGTYTQNEVNRGLPTTLLAKFFTQNGKLFQIKDEVRRMISFRKLNLIGHWPAMPPVDLLFVRNVLIYFDVDTKHRVLEKMRNVMHPEGVLFLGSSETTLNIHDGFQRAQFEGGSCYQIKPSE